MNAQDENTDEIVDIPESSKREYLLAQIRQKDAIIESLLKQVRVVYNLMDALGHSTDVSPLLSTPVFTRCNNHDCQLLSCTIRTWRLPCRSLHIAWQHRPRTRTNRAS